MNSRNYASTSEATNFLVAVAPSPITLEDNLIKATSENHASFLSDISTENIELHSDDIIETDNNAIFDFNISLTLSLNSTCSTSYSNSIQDESLAMTVDTVKMNDNVFSSTSSNINHDLELEIPSAEGIEMEENFENCVSENISSISHFEQDYNNSCHNNEINETLKNTETQPVTKESSNSHYLGLNEIQRKTCRLLLRGRGCVDRTSSLPKMEG